MLHYPKSAVLPEALDDVVVLRISMRMLGKINAASQSLFIFVGTGASRGRGI